jgi:type II secretory pathway predicted ATPase ExeA
MYESFFGLRERPFQLTPDPRFLFLSQGHSEALATLRYGLSSSPGITLLLGEAGTGKTTLLRAAVNAERRPGHQMVVLNNPTLTRPEFYEILANGFNIPHAAGSKARFLLDFQREVLERTHEGDAAAIVVDEAQSLTHELFEEVRLLANLETATAKLVNVVLVGQRELADRLNEPSLRQLKQRVSLRCTLAPLDLSETASYIATRLRVAGGDATAVFTREAVQAIYEASGGIPRTIGVVCHNALLGGYAARTKPVDRAIVAAVCRDFDLPLGEPPAREPVAEPPSRAEAGAAAPGPAAEKKPTLALVEVPGPGLVEDAAEEEAEPPAVAAGGRRFWFFRGRRRTTNPGRTLFTTDD